MFLFGVIIALELAIFIAFIGRRCSLFNGRY